MSEKPVEVIQREPGTAEWRTAAGVWCYAIHWSSDPGKDAKWARRAAALVDPRGMHGAKWAQEYELDDTAIDSERVYWAFDRARNVVARFPVPKDWPVSLGFDFGENNPTACIMLAQDPVTNACYVFDSLYRRKGLDTSCKAEVYEKLARHFEVALPELAVEGLDKYIERAVGDPAAPAYAAFYAMEPFPVSIIGNVDGIKTNDHEVGEKHVNDAFWPSFYHCGTYQHPRGVQATDKGDCLVCGAVVDARPRLLILDGAAPELEDELDALVRKEPTAPGLETPEVSVKTPDHACDALRYVCRFLSWTEAPTADRRRESEKRLAQLRAERFLDVTETFELMQLEAHERMEHEKNAEARGRLGLEKLVVGGSRYGEGRDWEERPRVR